MIVEGYGRHNGTLVYHKPRENTWLVLDVSKLQETLGQPVEGTLYHKFGTPEQWPDEVWEIAEETDERPIKA